MAIQPPDPADVAGKVAVSVVTEVLKKALSGLSEATAWVKDKARERDPLGSASAKYAERFERRYNTVRVFGMSQPVPLRSLYVEVNILQKITAEMRASLEDLERYLDHDRRSFGTPIKRVGALAAVEHLPRIVVLGKPGAGKTTFLKRIALYALDGLLQQKRVPVFINLKDWSESKETLQAYIERQFDICRFPRADLFIEHMLQQGSLLMLFDGLDEVTEDVDAAVRELSDFTDKYSKCQHVISCRIAAYNHVFGAFTDIEIADFDDRQIQSFIDNWFGAHTAKAKACWVALCEQSSTKELASIPLLLTLLCIAFDEAMAFPPNRAELYREAIEALLKKWDSSRSIRRDSPYKHLTLKHKEAMLCSIAIQSFQEKEYFFPRRVLTERIGQYLSHVRHGHPEDPEPEADAILRSIIAQHGLFVERAKGIYSFLHLTFQEYFAARYIVDHQHKRSVAKLVEAHWSDPRWREVIILAAGMMADADELIWHLLARLEGFAAEPEHAGFVALANLAPRIGSKGTDFALTSLTLAFYGASVLKEYWVREQNFEPAARLRDVEREIQGMISNVANAVSRRGGQLIGAPIEASFGRDGYDDRVRSYIYTLQLLEQCLKSECFLTAGTRHRAQKELAVWQTLWKLSGIEARSF